MTGLLAVIAARLSKRQREQGREIRSLA